MEHPPRQEAHRNARRRLALVRPALCCYRYQLPWFVEAAFQRASPWPLPEQHLVPSSGLGNDFDPVTPGRFADKMADRFGSAVSVRRAGYGHCSMSQPSKCIDKIVREYFVEGKVPHKGVKCDVDGSPFPQPKNETSVAVNSFSAEDAREAELSEAMAAISEAVTEYNSRRLL